MAGYVCAVDMKNGATLNFRIETKTTIVAVYCDYHIHRGDLIIHEMGSIY